jgi:hypothetical protein
MLLSWTMDQAWRIARALLLWLAAALSAFAVVFVASRALANVLGVNPSSVDPGLISTFAGVIGGVPVALLLAWLARQETLRAGAQQRSGQRQEVLAALRADLSEILAELTARDRLGTSVPFLRTDVWHVLASGGQLGVIDDPDLLGTLARAYHRIETTAYLERQLWEAFHDPAHHARRIDRATGQDASLTWLRSIQDSVALQDPHTRAAIDVALDKLKAHIG